MRYRRPNRRRHKPYPLPVQITAACVGLGLLAAPFTYGISLLLASLVAVALSTGPAKRAQ